MAVKTIGTGAGRDHVDVQAWETSLGTVITADETGECYDDGVITNTAVLNVDTTTNNKTLTLTTAAGEGWVDKIGSGALKIATTSGSGVLWRDTSAFDRLFDINTANVTVDGLQITCSGGSAAQATLRCSGSASSVTIKNCILTMEVNPVQAIVFFSGNTTASTKMENCLVYDDTDSMSKPYIEGSAGGATIDSCTIVAPSDNTQVTKMCDANFGGADFDFINCAIFGFDTVSTTGSGGTVTGDHNGGDATEANLPGGTGNSNQGLITFSSTSPFEGGAASAENFRIKSATTLQNNGATALTVDILGTTRPQGAADDIGCHELVVAAGGGIEVLRRRIEAHA